MRKTSKTRTPCLSNDMVDTELRNARPLRIPGATITSWPEAADVDLDDLFARPSPGATVSGSGSDDVNHDNRAPIRNLRGVRQRNNSRKDGTVALSDGTRITFAIANQFETAE